jgi:hypothetical protein
LWKTVTGQQTSERSAFIELLQRIHWLGFAGKTPQPGCDVRESGDETLVGCEVKHVEFGSNDFIAGDGVIAL